MTLQIRSARETLNVYLFVGEVLFVRGMPGWFACWLFTCKALSWYAVLCPGWVPGSRRDHSISEDISGQAGCWGLLSVWLELRECMSSLQSTATPLL